MSEISERSLNWVQLRGVDRRLLSAARLQAHHAVQWLARSARAYVPPQPDDGHTSLGWDAVLGGFTTYPMKGGSWLSLKVVDLTLTLHGGEARTPIKSFSLNGRAEALLRQWLGEQLGARGLDAQALDAVAPYAIPAHAVAEGAPYDPAGSADALAELAAWFGNAALSLASIQTLLIERGCSSSPVRCWPHHFDIATLTTLPAQSAGTAKSIGVGLSPGDEYYDEPYFYVSVYPEPDPQLLPTLPMLGHWHDRDFVAAVATAPRILKAENQQAETDAFLQAAVGAAFKVLS